MHGTLLDRHYTYCVIINVVNIIYIHNKTQTNVGENPRCFVTCLRRIIITSGRYSLFGLYERKYASYGKHNIYR